MIEKIIKAVKSNNKKRGKNITVGAVVGMLLSCTAVMGADNYLWIKNDGGEIKFSTDNSTPSGTENPYGENTWDRVDYVNNIALNSTSTDYGLKLEGDLTRVNFINNGLIGVTGNGERYGIYNAGTIGDIINIGSIIGTSTGSSAGYGISNYYSTKIGNIINSGLIAGIGTRGYGIYMLNDSTTKSMYNTGLIIGVGEIRSYAIAFLGHIEKDIINDGVLSFVAEGVNTSYNFGISFEGRVPTIKNNGLIIGKDTGKDFTAGIYSHSMYRSTEKFKITNIGSIVNTKTGAGIGDATGIYNLECSGEVDYIANSGLIVGANTGSGNGYGIHNEGDSYDSKIGAITNTGVIYGKTNAIKNSDNKATITSIVNYGILVTNGSSVIDNTGGGTITNTSTNYGLYIEGADGKVTPGSTPAPTDILIGCSGNSSEKKEIKRNMTIKNADITTGSDSKATDSFVFSSTSNEFDNSILNGKNDTLRVAGNREISGSIINAYGTAIVFDGADSQLTLSGTIVNGGADGTNNSIIGSGNGDSLTLQSENVSCTIITTNTGGTTTDTTTETQNTVINGKIDMKAGTDALTVGTGTIINGKIDMGDDNDTLTIEKGAQINGTLDGGSGDDTLNFGITGVKAISSSDEKINILHNISDFETIYIDSNVTFFEKTVADDGSLKNLTISGVNEINISAGSVLNLRIDTTPASDGKYNRHALFGNTALTINGDASKLGEGESITESKDGKYAVGVLNLVTNGLGLNSIIAMDEITLDKDLFTKTNSILDKAVVMEEADAGGTWKAGDIKVEADKDIFREVKASSQKYEKLNNIYNGVISSTDDNFIALKNIITINSKTEDYTSVTDNEQLAKLLVYLGDIYTGSPYSYSSELSRRSAGMFRDIVTENEFRPKLNNWLIMGGLTHADGGSKDTYYGRNYHGFDTGTSDTRADMKLTGAYMLGKYGYSENLTLGITVGGNKSEAEMSVSKVKGNSGYLGAFAENYRGNLTLKAGAGIQYSEYDADRRTVGDSYNDKYSDMTYDIYLNGRYSHQVGENLFLEPHATLSYTYIKQDGADEGSKTLAIETDSKSFDYTVGKVGVDLKKIIPHSAGKSTLSAGVSYTKIFDGADEEHITGRFKGGSDFDILVAHKNEHSIGLNAKYALELENGILFDVKGTYSVERDSNNNSGKNKTKGEWIVGVGLGYKF